MTNQLNKDLEIQGLIHKISVKGSEYSFTKDCPVYFVEIMFPHKGIKAEFLSTFDEDVAHHEELIINDQPEDGYVLRFESLMAPPIGVFSDGFDPYLPGDICFVQYRCETQRSEDGEKVFARTMLRGLRQYDEAELPVVEAIKPDPNFIVDPIYELL